MFLLGFTMSAAARILLPSQGQVYVVGLGDSGQLGLGPRTMAAPVPTCIPFPYEEYNIVHIAAGIAHNSASISAI